MTWTVLAPVSSIWADATIQADAWAGSSDASDSWAIGDNSAYVYSGYILDDYVYGTGSWDDIDSQVTVWT